jgi:hypothetical protein
LEGTGSLGRGWGLLIEMVYRVELVQGLTVLEGLLAVVLYVVLFFFVVGGTEDLWFLDFVQDLFVFGLNLFEFAY